MAETNHGMRFSVAYSWMKKTMDDCGKVRITGYENL